MPTKQHAQVVHESETQRQFVRVRLPAQIQIDTQQYYVKDISSGGVGIQDIEIPLKKGQEIDVTLILPFLDFSLDIKLTAQIQYHDKNLKAAGCRFVNLTPGQISTLNHVIKSYIAGDIVTGENVLHAVSRENFVKVRTHPGQKNESASHKIKTITSYAAISVVACALAFFILANIFESFFVIKTEHATISAKMITVESPAQGGFLSLLPEGVASVQKDQPLVRISKAENSVFASDRILLSPCDCLIREQFVTNNEFLEAGEKLFTLLPLDSAPWVSATVNMADIHRITLDNKANFKIGGSNLKFTGRVIDLKTDTAPTAPILGQDHYIPTGTVTIQSETPISADYIGRPVFVEFLLK